MATTPTPPSNSLPQPLSYEQILGQELSSYASALGINDLNVGSANVSFFKVVALMVARSSGDIFQILRDYSLDRATGPALQNLAIEYGVPPIGAKVSTGFVTVTDLSFQKIATKIYAGTNPPIAGSTTVYVSDASSFPATGSVYLGRTTVNVEGPLAYSAVTQIGSYWSLTLSSATTKFHNIGESVILAQGGVRTVPVNTIVVSPGIGTTPTIQYSVTQQGTILDGETTVSSVPITSQLPGSSGNVPASAITQFSGNPAGLPNASVNNPLALTTGADTETDDQLRVRVKNALASTGLGTVTAIESALQGVQDPNSSATIVSTDVLSSSSDTIVYVDDGTGYEATHQGVPIETIVNSALGGQKFFQLVTGGTQTSVTKAFLQSVAAEPFSLSGGEVLAVVVGAVTYQHTFASTDFANPGSATAYEVCASINANTSLNFEAVTAGGGTYVVIRPEDEVTNIIQATTPATSTVTDANTILQFPSQKAETLRLYKNGILLTQDGSSASVFTQEQSLWSNTLASGETLIIAVDGTTPITYTLTDADFVAEGTYNTLSSSNSLQSWVNVLNSAITGITASIVGSAIEISSNLGAIDRAKVVVSGSSSLVTKGVFSASDLTSTGVASDYILDRNTAQIQLDTALSAGDSLAAGSLVTQANIKGSAVSSGSATLTSNAHVWILIDQSFTIIPTITSGSTLSVSVSGDYVTYTSNSGSAFSNVLPGDYAIVWSAEIPSSDQLEGRVYSQTANTLTIKVTAAEAAAVTPVTNASYVQGFVVVRTQNVPQKFEVKTGTMTLQVIAAQLQTQTDQLTFSVYDNTNITVTTNTNNTTGEVTVITADASGALLGFVGGTTNTSQDSLIAFYETQASDAQTPLFFHSPISADSYAEPIDSYLTSFTSSQSLAGFFPNDLISFLNPYGGINDEQPSEENVQIASIATNVVTILPEYPDVRRLRIGDRFFVSNPLDFGYNDTVIAIVDNDTVGETYTMPLYRRAIVNNTYAANNYSFNAYDVATGSTAPFSQNFTGFSFANYKALLQAKYVLQSSAPQTALLYRSTPWGRTGQNINVSYVYPSSANQAVGSSVNISNSNGVSIQINLASGNSISTNISSSTQWNVTVTANTPSSGIDQVKYSYAGQYSFTVASANATAGAVYSNNGQQFTVLTTISAGTSLSTNGLGGAPQSSGTLTKVSGTGDATIVYTSYTFSGYGTAPNLTLSGGEYVNITSSTGFYSNNTGTFRVSTLVGYTPTSTSFTVQTPRGAGTPQSDAVTSVNNGINFYSASPTTAASINTYVNANLSPYVTTTIVNDGGSSGSGVITESTYENSGFQNSSYYLKDGINWIASSNVAGSPQFTFKQPLTYPSDTGYSFFTSGDEVRLVPTTMDQVKDLWNVLAVTGFTTVGTIETVERGNKLQIATNTIGSVGSIEVVGGSGNEYSVPVLTSGVLLGTSRMMVSANSIASQAMASDQWFRLQASNKQTKNTNFASNTSVTVASNTPVSGQSTVTLLNQTSAQLYFGAARNFPTVSGRTFRVENQGSLVCLSWNGSGSSPNFSSAANLNDSGGWTVNVSSSGVYTVASGATTFAALSIGDLINVTGCINAGNNGTFFIQSVSATSFGVSNPNAVTETGTAISAGEFSSTLTVSEGDSVIITAPFSPLNRGTYRVIRMNNNSIWYENADAIEEEVTCTASTQIQFYQYEATIPGDSLVLNGSVLGIPNAGTYEILSVTSPTVVVVSGVISSQTATNLGTNYTSFSVKEGTAYSGYKQIAYVVEQPGTSNFNDIVFKTSAQYEKIDLDANVAMVSLNKLNFPTTIRTGIDSYSYDTGLIGQANRVIYGDPRDAVTYPGVNAAGTDIFIREPLLKRIQIALAIRTNIGVSFAQITSQIQSSVYALIQSNPLGQSLDLSQIVETVRGIPGVTSVVLTSPAYSVTNDEIQLVTGEKAFIVNPATDISVALIGS